MSLRIAFDLDGVLADMDGGLERHARALLRPPESESALALTPRQWRQLWRHVKAIDDFWETLDEVEPGTVRRLETVAAEKRWEVIFLTKRPPTAGRPSQVQSQHWLESNGFRLPSVYVVHGSRGRIAAALGLDIVVDDRPENCLDVVTDSKARAILVWRSADPPPEAIRELNIGLVRSMSECLDLLTRAESAGRRRVVDTVAELLGLRASRR